MKTIKDYTGAVNINGDITPITREKIGQITPEKWHEMNDEALWEQRITLSERVMKANQAGHAGMAQQVQAGINVIDAILRQRALKDQLEREKSGKTGLI